MSPPVRLLKTVRLLDTLEYTYDILYSEAIWENSTNWNPKTGHFFISLHLKEF